MSAPYTNFAQLQQQGYARPPEPQQPQAELFGGAPLTRTADTILPGTPGNETEEERRRRLAAQQPTPQQPPQPGQQTPTATQPQAQPGMPTSAAPPPPMQPQAQPFPGQQQNSTGYGTMTPQPPPTTVPQGQFQPPDMFSGLYNAYASYMTPQLPQQGYMPQGYMGQQYMAQQRPQPQFAGQFNYAASPAEMQVGNSVSQQLQTPNRYDRQLAQDVYADMGANLDRDFAAQQQLINEDSARRGIYYSTIPAGRLGDLSVAQAQARRGFATDITREAANVNAGDQSAAIQNALGYGAQRYGQQQGAYQTNLGALGQNFGQDLSSRQFGGDELARQLQLGLATQNFNNAAGQQGFQNQLGLNQQGFGQQQQHLQNLLGFGQQGFQNQLAQAQFNAQQQQMYDQMLMNLYGGMG